MPKRQEKASWVEFSILVEEELAGHVSEALTGILPGGLVREREFEAVFPDQLGSISAPYRIFGFFPIEDEQEYKERINSVLDGLSAKLPQPVYSHLKDENWAAAWQERYKPTAIGQKLMIVPSWLENPDPNRIAVFIDPGMAFGSGTHPTTQLSLTLIERALSQDPQASLIDVGCGSGILSIAAAKLGARQVIGVDNDPDAIKASRENADKNKTAAVCSFQEGSVIDLLKNETLSQGTGMVVANIIAPILDKLFCDGLGHLVKADGYLILSGILKEQLPGIKEHLKRGSFEIREELEQEGWYGLLAYKTPG